MAGDVNNIPMLPHQFEFVRSDSPWELGDGGRGSGKTRALAVKLAMRAGHVGAREGLFRQKLIDLKTTTLRSLLDGDGPAPPVLVPGSYTHDKSMKMIKLHGGGEIVYNGMDQGDAAREFGSTGKGSSLNLSGAAFDEWVEIPEQSVIQVAMSVRVKVPGLPLQRYGVCNPGPPSHWLAKRFGMSPGGEPKKRHQRVICPASENWHNPPEFFDELLALEGVARERYWYGKWVGSDGLVYDRWDRQVHVTEYDGEPKRVLIGVDDGYSDPFAAYRMEFDGDGRCHTSREVYAKNMVETEKIAAVKSLSGGDEPTVVVDNAAPALIEALCRAGFHAEPCKKGEGSVVGGISKVQDRLVVAGDGRPRFTVDPSCTNLIREFESYEWKPDTTGKLRDKPRDGNDHGPDAVRYVIAHVDASNEATVTIPDADNYAMPVDRNRGWNVF